MPWLLALILIIVAFGAMVLSMATGYTVAVVALGYCLLALVLALVTDVVITGGKQQ